jgi:transcriptional regulator with XRE-family HTH domain
MKLRSAELLRAFVGPEESKKLSARRLSRTVGVSAGFINHLTAGRKNSCLPETADRIAQALGVPTDVLFEERLTTSERANDNQGTAA